MPRDYGYFGKGPAGYAQYMTAFRRSRKGGGHGGGGNGGCFFLLLGGLVVLAVIEAVVTRADNTAHIDKKSRPAGICGWTGRFRQSERGAFAPRCVTPRWGCG